MWKVLLWVKVDVWRKRSPTELIAHCWHTCKEYLMAFILTEIGYFLHTQKTSGIKYIIDCSGEELDLSDTEVHSLTPYFQTYAWKEYLPLELTGEARRILSKSSLHMISDLW